MLLNRVELTVTESELKPEHLKSLFKWSKKKKAHVTCDANSFNNSLSISFLGLLCIVIKIEPTTDSIKQVGSYILSL